MAEASATNDSSDSSGFSAMEFVKSKLGMGLIGGLVVALISGWVIL